MLSGFDYLSVFLFCFSCVFIFGYLWYLSVWVQKFEEFEKRLMTLEKDSKGVCNAIKQLHKNQRLFIKPGEHVIIYRQEEKFEQGQGDA